MKKEQQTTVQHNNSPITCATDCRTMDGIETGLIDGIIAMARIIRLSHVETLATREALTDLQQDEDMQWLMSNKSVQTKRKKPKAHS